MPEVDLKLSKEDFEARLQEKYNGTIRPLKPFISDRITLLFNCDKCKEGFFARPSYLLEIESQSHICGVPYGAMRGKRVSQVINGKGGSKKKEKPSKINPNLNQEIDKLLAEGVTAAKIAQKIGVNPNIIKHYTNTLKDFG